MKTTLNQVHEELKYIAECHNQINSFFWGDFLRAFKENVLNYPLMCCYITPNITFNKVISTVPINIVLCDKIFKDWDENLDDVESDMLDLCNQVYQIIRSAGRWQEMGVVVSASVPQKFLSQGGDEVCGYQMTINFKFKNEVCYENLPLTGYDFGGGVIPEPPACSPAIFQNSDTTYEKSIPSGSTFVSEDIEIILADGFQTFPSNVDIDLSSYAPVEPATVRNSDDTFEVIVNPGDTEVLPDIEVILGDGTQTFPSVKDLDLSSYVQIQKLPSGTYIPKNDVTGPFDLLWVNSNPELDTGDGFINRIAGADNFETSGYFLVNHNGDFTFKFKSTNIAGTAFPMVGLSYYKARNYYANIQHALYREGDTHIVYESGEGKAYYYLSLPVIQNEIQRIGNVVNYVVNGNIMRSIDVINTGPVNIDTSFAQIGQVFDIEILIP